MCWPVNPIPVNPINEIVEIVDGKSPITADTALEVEGVTAEIPARL